LLIDDPNRRHRDPFKPLIQLKLNDGTPAPIMVETPRRSTHQLDRADKFGQIRRLRRGVDRPRQPEARWKNDPKEWSKAEDVVELMGALARDPSPSSATRFASGGAAAWITGKAWQLGRRRSLD
jgi:hypothetical protein